MKLAPLSRLISLLAVLLTSVFRGPCLYADDLDDGTVALPRSGREIVSLPSPAAAELCRHIDHAIDYSTGCVSLSCFSRLSQKLTAHPLPSHKALPKGLPTGSWSKVLSSSGLTAVAGTDSALVARNGYLGSTAAALCYDSRDRLVATATADHLGGLCLETSTLNNAGMPLTTQFSRWPLTAKEATESHKYTYTYDALGRASSVTLTRGSTVYKLSANTYDAIGRLSK